MPTAASTSARPAISPSSSVLKRCGPMERETISSMLAMSVTGCSESTAQISLCTAAAMGAVSPCARTSRP